MARYKMVVMSKPAAGREQEYNDWYQNVHLKDVCGVKGVVSAQRFRFSLSLVQGSDPLPYLAIYDIETDDINQTLADLTGRVAAGQMVISTALSLENSFGAVYEEMGPVVRANPLE